MSPRILAIAAGAALVAVGVVAGNWWAHRSMDHGAVATPAAAEAGPGRRILYWHDPMYPQQKFDKPGRSPFMEMDLVPVYADEGGSGEAGVKVSPRLAQNLGVRTAVAERGSVATTVQASGAIAFDERAVELVQSRTAAYVEALLVRAPLDAVDRGQPLVRLFVPEWAGAQQEYLALKAGGAADLARAARNRLLLLGMSEAQVAEVDAHGKPVSHVTLVSPVAGVVGELGAREGMTVPAGTTLFRINGLATVWVNVEVPETQAAAVRPGAPIEATVPAYPGETFRGRVSAVLPRVDATTRTLGARVELANPGTRLKPGMYATVRLVQPAPARAAQAVLVPTEALIVTGTRKVVIVDRGEGRYEPVDVEVGREEGGKTEIVKGVEAGARVVASGQFLLDSEASLRGFERRTQEAK